VTAINLIEFYKVLPLEEQYKFLKLAESCTKPKSIKYSKKEKPVLSDAEALQYLTSVIFKNKNS
jgi:hypothetical protein